MNYKRNCFGVVSELYSDQYFCKTIAIMFIIRNFWSPHLAEPGLRADLQADEKQVNFEIFKIVIG